MARRIARPLSIACLVAGAAACASASARFYTLDALATPDGAPPASYTVLVGPVSVPASVDRPQFVVQVAPNRVEVDEFNRWVAPLGDGVGRAVAGNLATLLGTPNVAATPLVNFAPTYRVTIAVQRFDSMPGEAVVFEAVWTVRAAANGATRSGSTAVREPVQGASYDRLAAAHSRALATMSGDIAAAIRADAGGREARR